MIKKRVLIIDDEVDLCHLMKTYLSDLDYDVYIAYTLDSGLSLLKEVSPDILFIDNNLPDGLGWEKLDYIRETYPSCKINLISAYQYVLPNVTEQAERIKVIEKPMRLHVLKDYL